MLTDAQLTGADPLLTPLPVGARVERAFGVRIRRLPAASKTLLLIAAADDAGELATVLHAGEQLGISDSALDAIEHADLLHLEGQRLTFHHPLVRSAAYHTATVSQRRAAHTAIASVLDAPVDADRLAWHRAAAALTPDPDAVAELDADAKRARSRSGFAAASHALERAATLTGDERERSARLIAAVENSWLAGRIDRARDAPRGHSSPRRQPLGPCRRTSLPRPARADGRVAGCSCTLRRRSPRTTVTAHSISSTSRASPPCTPAIAPPLLPSHASHGRSDRSKRASHACSSNYSSASVPSPMATSRLQ
jgi:hypothetical protein